MIGIDDEEFLRDNIPMTKQEIRILTLAKARINSNSVVVGTDVYYKIYAATLINLGSPEIGSMIFCLLWSLPWLVLAEIFYRRGIVIKI